ncbi:hypothetical protein MRB53_026023 [Persea americana]|uniref:Uncharacterized protein n=1 Tax=Persea americana TaxID=3435 RepID=A0ACC2LHX2_PERAE|nr:hypothetical protein MRB53_026023 [Persea americana]
MFIWPLFPIGYNSLVTVQRNHIGCIFKDIADVYLPQGRTFSQSVISRCGFHQLGFRAMTTNKDRIERLETDIQELKEGFEKMSEIVSKSIHELSTKLSSDKHATKNSTDEDS